MDYYIILRVRLNGSETTRRVIIDCCCADSLRDILTYLYHEDDSDRATNYEVFKVFDRDFIEILDWKMFVGDEQKIHCPHNFAQALLSIKY